MMRPPMPSRATAASVISTTSYSPSEGTCTDETALTTPDLSSPRSKMGAFDLSFPSGTYPAASTASLTTVRPNDRKPDQLQNYAQTPFTAEMAQVPTVKERATAFETADQHSTATPRVMTDSSARPVLRRSTSPLRINRRSAADKVSKVALESATNLASPTRRKPVPQALDTASSSDSLDRSGLPRGLGVQFDPLSAGPSTQAVPSPVTPMSRATSSYFVAGKETTNIPKAGLRQEHSVEIAGSAKRLIQHWENRPLTDQPFRERDQTQTQTAYRYLNSKPLPTPGKISESRGSPKEDALGNKIQSAGRNDSNYGPMRTIDGWASSDSLDRPDSGRLKTPTPATRLMRTPSPTLSIRSGPSYGPDSPRHRRGVSAVSPIKGAISKFKDFGRRARDKGKAADVLGGLLSNVAERRVSRAYAQAERGPESDERFGSAGLLNGIVYLDDLEDAALHKAKTSDSDLITEEKPLDRLGSTPTRVPEYTENQIRSSLESLLRPIDMDGSGPHSIETIRTLRENADQMVPCATVHSALENPPITEHELSIFRQTASIYAQQSPHVGSRSGSAVDNDPVAFGKSPPASTECVLDFDPADLNPSRSASQVRRPASEFITLAAHTVGQGYEEAPPKRQFALDDDQQPSLDRQLTHISRVAFPEPRILGNLSQPEHQPALRSADGGDPTGPDLADSPADQGAQRLSAPGTVSPSLLPSDVVRYAGKEYPLAAKLQAIQTDLRDLALKVERVVAASESTSRSSINHSALSDRLASIELAVQDTRNALLLSKLAEEGLQRRPVVDESGLASIHSKLELLLHSCGPADRSAVGPPANPTAAGPEAKGNHRLPTPVLVSLDPDTTKEEEGAVTETPDLAAEKPSALRMPVSNAVRNAKPVKKSKARGATPAVVSSSGVPSSVEPTIAAACEESGKPAADEEQQAGEEVAKIMSNVAAVTDEGPKQSARSLEKPGDQTGEQGAQRTSEDGNRTLSDALAKQLGDVVKQVTELNEARSLQTQNSNDIVKYLTKMDVWLETLVKNMGEGIESVTSTLTGGIPQAGAVAATPASLMGLVLDLQGTMRSFQASEATRTETFTAMIQENRQRMLGLSTVVEQMRSALSQQQAANEQMLQSLSADQKSIKGEMVRFVEAMKEAVAFDVEARVGRFEQLASYEVNKAISQVSDLSRQHGKLLGNLAVLHSMHAVDASQALVAQAPRAITSADGMTAAPAPSKPALPVGAGRGLPPAPGAKGIPKGKK